MAENLASPVGQAHARRLFVGSCVALTASSMMFALMADVIPALKEQFILTNEQIGWIRGTGWGFTLAIILLGPLCDALGMRSIIALAFACHTAGALLLVFAGGFWTLFAGGALHAFGAGSIEAACNPLIATIYPQSKTEKLNQFHMWFPGGIVIGGLLAYLFTKLGLGWQWKLALVLPPTAAYALLFIGEKFPPTERVQAGVSGGEMVRESLSRPLFLVLLFCMMLTASLELGPMGWVSPVLEAGGVPGILVLVWITGLMAVLRYFAGPIVNTLGNINTLLLSAVVAGAGLVCLSFAGGSAFTAGAAATVFALGVCYFWPTMLGTAAERVPRGGAMALAMLGGIGGLFVNLVTTPQMGRIADKYLHRELVRKVTVDGRTIDRQQETVAVLQAVDGAYADWIASLGDSRLDKLRAAEAGAARRQIQQVLKKFQETGSLPEPDTANALRAAIGNGPRGDAATASGALRSAIEARDRAAGILNPAENKGGLISFRYVAPLSIVLILIFGAIRIRDMRAASAQTKP